MDLCDIRLYYFVLRLLGLFFFVFTIATLKGYKTCGIAAFLLFRTSCLKSEISFIRPSQCLNLPSCSIFLLLIFFISGSLRSLWSWSKFNSVVVFCSLVSLANPSVCYRSLSTRNGIYPLRSISCTNCFHTAGFLATYLKKNIGGKSQE